MHNEVGITSIPTNPLPFFSRITQTLREYGVLYFLPDISHIHTVSAHSLIIDWWVWRISRLDLQGSKFHSCLFK